MKKTLLYFLAALSAAALCSCSLFLKKEDIKPLIQVTTDNVTDLSYTSAKVQITVTDGYFSGDLKEIGICYCKNGNPDYACSRVKAGNVDFKSHSISVNGLIPDTQYFVRAYVSTSEGVYYGDILPFKTITIGSPQVKTLNPESIKETSAVVGAQLISNGGDNGTYFGVCWAAHQTPTMSDKRMDLSSSENTNTIYYLDPGTQYYCRAYAVNSSGIIYGEEVTFTTLKPKVYNYIEGTIKAPFSISDTRQVAFSKGNLQYQPSSGTWRFADKQYSVCGSDNRYPSSSSTFWIDMFGWGTSGYNNCYPYMTSKNSTYGPQTSLTNTEYDWGYHNAISNGGNESRLWFTMEYTEWTYLLGTRENASHLRGFATVNGLKGMVILPDNWEQPQSSSFSATISNFTDNSYSISQWETMEGAGAVFLPISGAYYQQDLMESSVGIYWSSSYSNETYCGCLQFKSNLISTTSTLLRCCRIHVRLVTEL